MEFSDQSSVNRIEKAKRFLRALSDPNNQKYFFDDGFPRTSMLQTDSLAALEVVEELEKQTMVQSACNNP